MNNSNILLKFILKSDFKFIARGLVLLLLVTGSVYSQIVPIMNPPLRLGQSVVTYFADSSDYVVRVIDLRNRPPFISGGNYWNTTPEYAGRDWTHDRMKDVFGIALDDATPPNIYISRTAIFSNQMGADDSVLIYKIDGVTWAVTNYVYRDFGAGPPQIGTNQIPNTGSAIGNICFDTKHNQLFATNFEDGKIYRIGPGGIVLSVFDPFVLDIPAPSPAAYGERLWGIGAYGTSAGSVKIYFSRVNSDLSWQNAQNQIYSVQLDNSGEFVPGPAQHEIDIPPLPNVTYSPPVSDIEFSFKGDMLLAERSMYNLSSGAHSSRVLEYTRSIIGTYSSYTVNFIGDYIYRTNACGGVDYEYGITDSLTKMNSECDSIIVATGDILFYGGGYVYGLQVTQRSQGSSLNFLDNSHFIDINGILGTQDKTFTGDVDVYRADLCQDTTCMSIISDTTYCDSTGTYIYEFEIRNNSPTKYIEELEIAVDSPQPPNYVVAVPSNFTFSPPIPPLGSSGVKKVKLIGPGAVATSQVCYTLSAHFVNDDCPWCCFIENCIKLEECGTCAEVVQDSIYCVNGEYFFNFTLQNGTRYNVTKIQLTSPGIQPITFIPQTFHFGTPILPGQMFPNLTTQILGGAAGMNIPVRIKLFSGTFECCYFELNYTLPPCDTLHLNLRAFIEGRYNESTNLMVGDTIDVELRNTFSPYSMVETSRGYLNDSGKSTLNFYYTQNNTDYYLVLKHRNSIETWSKSSGERFTANVLNYDFLLLAHAYGGNLCMIDAAPEWYGIHSGDVNQDGIIDLSDITSAYNDASDFQTGYLVTDVTGDNIVDLSDITMAFNHANSFVSLVRP